MSWTGSRLISLLGTEYPLIQAPMARVATAELVAAVSGAGGLGSLGAGASPPDALREQIAAIRRLTDRPFAVNLFAPLERPAPPPGAVERMSELLAPWRDRLGLGQAPAPTGARPSFEDQFAVVHEERPPVVSFTFGMPPPGAVSQLREAGTAIIGTATTVAEAQLLAEADCDAIVAQGSEAGGHRGTFATAFESALIGTVALVPQIADRVSCPVIAAGGIMDGRGIAAALALGADGVQVGTAFIGCEESAAPPSHTRSLAESDDTATTVADAFTGRPARGMRGALFDEVGRSGTEVLPYPIQQEMMMELLQAGVERGDLDVVIRLAGQGAPMMRRLPAARLVAELAAETEAVLSRLGAER